MGNKACILCIPIENKRKLRNPNPIKSSTTIPLPSFTNLILENSLNSNNATPLPQNDIPPFTCQICCESKPLNDSFNVEGCTHFYCTKCIAKYILSKLQENVVNLMCPEPECPGVLIPNYCKPILPNNMLVWWENALSEAGVPEKNKFYCPYKDCSALLINDGHKGMVIRNSKCPHCKRLICAQCKVPWHPELSCEKFQGMKGRNDDLMLDLAKRRRWRRCPNCKVYVEKKAGCNDIICRCHHRFCYACGFSSTSYTPHSHICPGKGKR